MDFPLMLYRPGSEIEWAGGKFDTLIVGDAEECEIAQSDGWLLAADASRDPLDHDGDGKKGGAKVKVK